MAKPWTVQDAKAHLSELLRRERDAEGLGAWLVASAPRGEPLPDVDRGNRRPVPFADDDAPPAPARDPAASAAR